MKTAHLLSAYEPQVYAILRIVTGFLFLWHGSQKLFDFPPHPGYEIPLYIILLGGIPEFFGGLLVMTGFLTRWAAFLCSGEMAVAYWLVHGRTAVLPLLNHGELALVYCFLFLFIASHGAGMFSIDQLIRRRRVRG